ncbi:hypothetical protein AMS60_02605 [Bacillus sp. FJAT-21945]|nr:hypothetical protein AMS60_02605 [Bacillus sp. FJAT-21945]
MVGFLARHTISCRFMPKTITTEAPCQDPFEVRTIAEIALYSYFDKTIKPLKLMAQKHGKAGFT